MEHNEPKKLENLKNGMLYVGERSLVLLPRLYTWKRCIPPHALIAVASVIPKFHAIGGLEVRLY
jgi:hypothetical protein